MRLFRKVTHHCQGCKFGNNKKGKYIYHWYRKAGFYEENNEGKLKRDLNKQGYWYVFCEKKSVFKPWNKYKRCFQKKLKKT